MVEAEQWWPEAEEVEEAWLKASATIDVANGHRLDKYGGNLEDADVMDILDFDGIGANIDDEFASYIHRRESPVATEKDDTTNNILNGPDDFASYFHRRESPIATEKDDATNNILNGPGEFTHFFPHPVSPIATKKEKKTINMVNGPGDFTHFFPRPVSPIATDEDDTTIKMLNEPGDFIAFYPYYMSKRFAHSFNPFDIFRRPKMTIDPTIPSSKEGKAKVVVRENESCFSMFWIIGREKDKQKLEDAQSSEPVGVNRQPVISSSHVQPSTYVTGTTVIPKGTITFVDDNEGGANTGLPGASQGENEDTTINIANEPEPVVVAPSRGRPWLGYDGLLAEILKSIVYGGLMEVIASLSVVASAAASDATTLSIISVALASLMGGVFIIGHNLWDLRDDCYKDSSNNEAVSKYKELLGQVNYFPLHAFFAILSFLVFGMVPPVAYGYAFHETNDKDFTVAAVATASLICVALLAIFKAYINKCTIFEYFKTMAYYVTTAVSVSGVSYVAGNLVTRLMEYGLFGPSSGGGMSFFPDATEYLASF